MDIDEKHVPKENMQIFKLLYWIEVGLRELIIDSLATNSGPFWWKSRLPSDVLDNFRKGRTYETGIIWNKMLPHHPIYYIEFPDLQKVITRSDNWSEVFRPIFGRKDMIAATLSQLEPVRNKIAHNRKATPDDVHIVETAYELISGSIGNSLFETLCTRMVPELDIVGRLAGLEPVLESAYQKCLKCQILEQLDAWNIICTCWWFDSEYLGHEIGGIDAYFKMMVQYAALPRNKGEGHKIESWVKAQNIDGIYSVAKLQLTRIIENSSRL